MATLAGGVLAGLLWDRAGHAAAFVLGIGTSLAAGVALVAFFRPKRHGATQ
jgi:hypothetical protein